MGLLLTCVTFARAQTTIDNVNKYAYSANGGWLNFQGDVANGVIVSNTHLSGFIFSGNMGWIKLGDGSPANGVSYSNLSSDDYGVNLDGSGVLSGFAYGANIGWIQFETNGNPRIDIASGNFSGFIYGQNIGWISLSNMQAFVMNTSAVFGADLGVVKLGSPDPVIAGETLTYTITVTNSGPQDATSVQVVDNLPGGITPSGTVIANLGTLAANTSTSFNFMVTVDDDTTGSLENIVTVSSATDDNNMANNTFTQVTTVAVSSDLAIFKNSSPDPVIAGETLTYTISVTNFGPSVATGVQVIDTLPGGVTPSGVVIANLGTLAVNSGTTFSFMVTVDSDTVGSLNNVATVSSDGSDPNNADNGVVETTTITTSADLGIFKTDSPDPVLAGSLLTYTISVTNFGPSDATGVQVTDNLPGGITPSGTVISNLGTIAANASVSFNLEVTVDVDTSTPLTNVALVSSSVSDPNGANDSATEVTTVAASLDWGDAPSPYPTVSADNGARHVASGPRLGATRDSETDGQPNASATGDGSDEDGVTFGLLAAGSSVSITVNVQEAVGQLDAWIDFNTNGIWESSEQIASNLAMNLGDNLVSVEVSCDSPVGATYARFRLSSTGSLATTGSAIDGEVEDYQVSILKDATPPTLLTLPMDVTVECDGSGNLSDIHAYLNAGGGAAVSAVGIDFGSGASVFPYTQSGFTLEEHAAGTAQQTIGETFAPAGEAELEQISLNDAGTSSNSVVITNNLNQFFDLLTVDVEALDLAPLGTTVGVVRVLSSAGGEVQVSSTGTLNFDSLAVVADTNAWNNLTWVRLVFNDTGNGLPSVTFDNLTLQTKNGISARDNCSLALSLTNDYSSLAAACGGTGSTNIIFTVFDECGNGVSATGSFTVVDTTRPTIVCPTDLTVECDGESAGIYWAIWP
ncbi:MAG: DUF11 domain-containing protein [Verrucomicrobiota bacterium]